MHKLTPPQKDPPFESRHESAMDHIDPCFHHFGPFSIS